MCVGAARELRLRPNAAALVEEHPDAITRQTVDERLALTVESAPLEPLPLAAIVIPGPSRTANGGRCPAAVATGCAVEVPGVPARLWLAPARCADPRLRHAESPRQRRAGVRGGDPLGTTVRALGRPCPRGARRWTRRVAHRRGCRQINCCRRNQVDIVYLAPSWRLAARLRPPAADHAVALVSGPRMADPGPAARAEWYPPHPARSNRSTRYCPTSEHSADAPTSTSSRARVRSPTGSARPRRGRCCGPSG